MRRREFLKLIGGSAAWPMAAVAQDRTLPVIGFLHSRGPEDAAYVAAAFRRGLRDAGFIDACRRRADTVGRRAVL
jgi:putative ABC transport system substrate-binding protein